MICTAELFGGERQRVFQRLFDTREFSASRPSLLHFCQSSPLRPNSDECMRQPVALLLDAHKRSETRTVGSKGSTFLFFSS